MEVLKSGGNLLARAMLAYYILLPIVPLPCGIPLNHNNVYVGTKRDYQEKKEKRLNM